VFKMRAFFALVCVAALFAFASADDDTLPDFVPCSFTVVFNSEIMNPDNEVVATSKDRIMRDNDLDLWRWDSDFTGLLGVLEPQKWTVIWRPDIGENGTSYHDYGEKCLKNNGRPQMAPRMYQWLYEKTYGMNWFRNIGTFDGLPCFIYHSKFVVKQYQTTMTADIHVLQKNGALLHINGTATSDKYGLDLHYTMDVEFFEQHEEVRPTYFIPSAHCTDNTPISAPAAPSEDFEKSCYGLADSSLAVRTIVSWAAVLLALVAALFM